MLTYPNLTVEQVKDAIGFAKIEQVKDAIGFAKIVVECPLGDDES